MLNNPSVVAIIPARYASSRLPGKPLLKIGNKTIIQRVFENVCQADGISEIFVATDNLEISKEVSRFGGKCILTDENIKTGTDRCYDALTKIKKKYDIVINVQGDEPFVNPVVIEKTVRKLLENNEAVCSTPVSIFKNNEETQNPNSVKVVLSKNQYALYFSRRDIPFVRNKMHCNQYKHIGLYAYRTAFLKQFVNLQQTPLEKIESLEQLRILENDFKIICAIVEYDSLGIDTKQDLENARIMFANKHKF